MHSPTPTEPVVVRRETPLASASSPADWGKPGHLTPDEEETLSKFRTHFASLELPPRWDDDDTLCRFLRARQFDLALATAMLEDTLRWRREFSHAGGVDALLHFEYPEEAAVRAGYPQCYHKTDKEGRPILLDMVGRVDATKLRESTDYERLTKFCLHRMEHNLQVKYPICSEVAGRPVGESVIIIDLKGFRPSQFTSDVRGHMQRYFKILQDNYPERMGKMFVINAPALFAGVWLVVKNFVDVRTRSKVDILGSKYTAKLLEVVDRSVLPTIFGGDDDSLDLSRDQGPWMGRAPPPPLVRVVSASPETVSPASQTDSARSPPTVPKPSPERARELIEKRRSVASPLSRAVAS